MKVNLECNHGIIITLPFVKKKLKLYKQSLLDIELKVMLMNILIYTN